MRADAVRNRSRLMRAAADAFAEHGLDVPVAEIARRAGVGAGTLFRHFPTKDDLIAAIVEQRIEEIVAIAQRAAQNPDPWQGLVDFVTGAGELQAADRGLIDSIRPRVLENPALDDCRGHLLGVVTDLLERGKAAGVVRVDLAPQDIPFLVHSVARAGDAFPGSEPGLWRRYLGIVIDGLRPQGASPLPCAPPSSFSTSAEGPASAPPRSSGSSRATPAPSGPA